MNRFLAATVVALGLSLAAPPLVAQDFVVGARLGIGSANFGGDIQDLDESD